MKKILSVDTTKTNHIQVQLFIGRDIFTETSRRRYGSQVLLDLIKKVLKKAQINLKEIDQVKVKTGPGSFTGIKVGAAVANALAFGLGITVNGKQIETDLKY